MATTAHLDTNYRVPCYDAQDNVSIELDHLPFTLQPQYIQEQRGFSTQLIQVGFIYACILL